MIGLDPALKAAINAWSLPFMLVLARVAAAVMVLPGLGEAEAPARLRIGLAVAITLLILPGIAPLMPPMPDDPWHVLAMVVAELSTGLWLGWLARLVVLALPMAGQIISYMAGLSSVIAPDPSGTSQPALGRLLGLAAPVLVLGTGLYSLPLAALAGSYRLIAPGTILPVGDANVVLIRALAEAFALALRLAAPFVIVSTVWQVALGLLSRLVPQLQIYFNVLPAQIIGAFLLLALVATEMVSAWSSAANEAFSVLPGAF